MSKYEALKQAVFEANLAVKDAGLVLFTWGNVSGRDPINRVVAIKPSGVPYEKMKVADIVVVDYEGQILEGALKPSVDLPSHLEIYKAHPDVGAIVHTHSTYATSFAQAGRDIPMYGTTHADYFADSIPCARYPREDEMDEYEKNTGKIIASLFPKGSALKNPAAIVHGHGAFAWGKDPQQAVYHAVVLEEVARMAYLTEVLNDKANPLPKHIRLKHFERKHGPKATYGQKK